MRGRKAKFTVERAAVGYTRVSTLEQVQHGSSLGAQQNRLRALATAKEEHLSEVYCDDGYSAGSLRRPELQRLLTAIRLGLISAVYVTKLDRLTRSLADLLEVVKLCEKANVAIVSASESLDTSCAAGKMMLQLLGTFAEFERRREVLRRDCARDSGLANERRVITEIRQTQEPRA